MFVVDASFVASLFLPDEASERASSIVNQIAGDGAAAPALWQLEVANLLLMAERRKRIDASQFSRLVDAWDALPVAIQPALTAKQRGDVLHLAHKHHLTAYDAAYLELALRMGATLATLDKSLSAAATAEGVALAITH